MIIDSIQNASKYFAVHLLFQKAFEYIQHTDLYAIETGKFDIDGDYLKVIVAEKKGMTKAEASAKFECHNHHIDIRLCVKGNEQIGWKPRAKCVSQKGDYNPDKDVLFYSDEPDMFFQLTDGQFAIFFPEDVHAPMTGEGEIKKLVVKVKI